MFLLKLALVPLTVLLASLAARRYGHAVSGLLSGFPIIGGPIVIALMTQMPPGQVGDIAEATLASCPAAIAFIVSFAWLALRLPWWMCLLGSYVVFLATGLALGAAPLSLTSRIVLAAACPFLALLLMPRTPPVSGRVPVPRSELGMRVIAATVLAAALLLLAPVVPPAISGLLLAVPISGSILPSFTAALYGAPATVALLRGFATGLLGFTAFFACLAVLLRSMDSYLGPTLLSVVVSTVVGLSLHQLQSRGAFRVGPRRQR